MSASRFGRRSVILGIPAALAAQKSEPEKQEEKVSPAEDLMREHGVLKRALLVYKECIARLDSHKDPPASAISGTAKLIREFIESYHEKLEEEFLFPRFRKAHKLVDLVKTLESQHEAGRRVTAKILQATHSGAVPSDEAGRRALVQNMQAFIRMYEPHEAREDTVLFPAFHEIVSPKEYDALGEQFEDREHKLFGEGGFEKMVGQVADLEKSVGIYDLDRFTPHV